jgi:hypothetical protein
MAATSRAVADIDREKLARILGMMGSSHDGEALAAARQAEKIRSSAGLTWFDVLRPPSVPFAPDPKPAPKPKSKAKPKASTASTERPKRRSWPRTFDLTKLAYIEAACDFVLAYDVANEWELGFLAGVRQLPKLSQKGVTGRFVQNCTLGRKPNNIRDFHKVCLCEWRCCLTANPWDFPFKSLIQNHREGKRCRNEPMAYDFEQIVRLPQVDHSFGNRTPRPPPGLA